MRVAVRNYDGLYECDEKGNIYSLITNKMLKPSTSSKSERIKYTVCLMKEGKRKTVPVHKIIYEAFNGEVNDGFIIHKDKNYNNNELSNLEYVESLRGLDKIYKVKPKPKKRDYNTEPLENEVFVDLLGHEDKYKVSNFCRFVRKKGKHCSKEFIVCQFLKNTGYYSVKIDGKTCCSHKLMYESFYGKIKEGNEIDHIDSNSLNNNLSNLREVTPEKNKKNQNTLDKIEQNRLHTGYILTYENGEEKKYFSIKEASEKEGIKENSLKQTNFLKRRGIHVKKFKYYK
jgi:hypothetical protein